MNRIQQPIAMEAPTSDCLQQGILKSATASIAASAIGRPAIPANPKPHHARIGVGGMGWVDLNDFKDHQKLEIVTLCDVAGCRAVSGAAEKPGSSPTWACGTTDFNTVERRDGHKQQYRGLGIMHNHTRRQRHCRNLTALPG